MQDKPIIINDIDVSECENALQGKHTILCAGSEDRALCDANTNCSYKKFKRKEQEYEELRQYHNKCCTEFENEKQALLEKYNQVSTNFYNGDYCNTEWCSLLKAKEQECNKLYIQLKADEEYHKEEENTLRKIIKNKEERNIELYKENNQLKVNNEKMSKGYAELTEIVSSYINDFTGYNEKLGGFDIVLCVKELLQQLKHLQTENDRLMILKDETYFKLKEEYLQHLDQLKAENEKIKENRDYYKRIVDGCPEICENGFCLIDFYNKKLTKTIIEIKEIAETQRRYIDDIKGFMFDDKIVEWKRAYIDFSTACRRSNLETLQKISEVLNEQ